MKTKRSFFENVFYCLGVCLVAAIGCTCVVSMVLGMIQMVKLILS